METQTISTKRAAQDVGQRISREFADYLTGGFKHKFPAEKPAVFIAKETIMRAFEHLDNVSGIRFMYGYESADDAGSRVLLLIPCNNTSTHLDIPNSIILPQGYMAHNGKRVSFEKTWQLLYNHTSRFSNYFPGLAYNKIMRGSFIGINSLVALLEMEGCIGINFNFGYDDTIAEAPAKNKPVFEAVNHKGDVLDILDFTTPCPAYCDIAVEYNSQVIGINTSDIGKCLELNKHFRDEYLLKQESNGAFVEMYYYVKPSILEKIAAVKNAGKIYEDTYQPQIAAFNRLLESGNYEGAKTAFENTIKGMMETYLFQ